VSPGLPDSEGPARRWILSAVRSAFMTARTLINRGSRPPHFTGDDMRKLRTAAVLVVAFGSLGLLGAGTANAGQGDGGFNVTQSSTCTSHDLNLDILGEVGIANGLGGNLLNGEGNPGAQATDIGSTMGCDNSAF
jgi:hypothetical protein